MSVTPGQRREMRAVAIGASRGIGGTWSTRYAEDVPRLLHELVDAERRAETAEHRLAAHSAPVEEAIEE